MPPAPPPPRFDNWGIGGLESEAWSRMGVFQGYYLSVVELSKDPGVLALTQGWLFPRDTVLDSLGEVRAASESG